MIIIGHRGAKGLVPENTIASLRKAALHHVDEIEFDLRVTSDDIVILNHDLFLSDAAGSKLVIADHTYEQLKAHKDDLATFREVIDEIGPTTPLYAEVKPGERLGPIIEQLSYALRAGFTAHDLLLASFSQSILVELHAAFPELTTVVLERWSGVRATYRAKQLGTKRLSMNQRWLWRPFIEPMAKRGWQLSAYTLNDTAKATRWAGYGLYGVVTDYPDLFEPK
jgi:glycerophosphoryl diester phosphodiesterase